MSDALSSSPGPAASHWWCYHCNKRVTVETLEDFVLCSECNKGFVQSIQAYSSPVASPPLISPDRSARSNFLQIFHRLSHPPLHRSPSRYDLLANDDDFFRLELDNVNEIEDREDGEEDEEEENLTAIDEEEEDRREISPITTRSRTGRNRILGWAEILMGIEDNSNEFLTDLDRYSGDYIEDGLGYEAFLQNLAEGDVSGRRGAPPAAKSVIDTLETFEVSSCSSEVCAVCKDGMMIGEIVKKLPCGHSYHGDCIVPWLGIRNSCPVCRFQLQTDDVEYEEERKNRTSTLSSSSSTTSASSSSASRQ